MFFILILIVTSHAYCYLDGGMGGMLVQLLLGGAAGLLMTIKLYWRKWFPKKGDKDDTGSSQKSDKNA